MEYGTNVLPGNAENMTIVCEKKASSNGIKLESCGEILMKDTVAGIELFCGHMGVDTSATFSYAKCKEGYEVIMHFRGERRFALCTHENDAQVIVDAMNGRIKWE